jgi:hypothetical protein
VESGSGENIDVHVASQSSAHKSRAVCAKELALQIHMHGVYVYSSLGKSQYLLILYGPSADARAGILLPNLPSTQERGGRFSAALSPATSAQASEQALLEQLLSGCLVPSRTIYTAPLFMMERAYGLESIFEISSHHAYPMSHLIKTCLGQDCLRSHAA